jgi:excisionase family DNA binding protein
MSRKTTPPIGDLLSATQAAQLLGVTRQHIYLLIRHGTLPKIELGGFTLVPRAAVETYAKTERKPGPKPK